MDDKPLQEKCGLVGIWSPRYSTLLPLSLLAAGGVQHRGQHGAGVAMQTKKGIKKYVGDGLIREVFTRSVINKLNIPSLWTIVHCRYGTHGDYQKNNLQPCVITTKGGNAIAIIHNGEFVATEEMRKKIPGKLPAGISDTYIFSRLLALIKAQTWEEKIIKALSQVNGAYSLIIGIEDKLFVARDNLGIRPLIIGQKKDRWIVASESHALDKVGVRSQREVKRGEIIKIDKNGLTILSKGASSLGNFCDFEWAYFSRPDSVLSTGESSLSIGLFRERCGTVLAKEHPIKNATFVIGIPDSGILLATGYASALKLPYRNVVIRDHFDPNGSQRLFMRDDQKNRIRSKVLGKLSLLSDKHIWKNSIVVIGDDSIVRGNVSAKITKAIFSLGAKEVHWIIGFPPITHRCHLGVSIRTKEELIAVRSKSDPKKIAKKIGATSVNYISMKGFIQARLEKPIKNYNDLRKIFLMNGGCGGCITGLYPIDRNGKIYSSV